MNPLTHFDAQGQAHMVDVAAKAATHRVAVASGRIEMLPATLALDFAPASAQHPGATGIACTATVETVAPTGVEMEALTAVQVALLTIYDMCKAADRGMSIHDVRVLQKHGGKSGSYVAPGQSQP